MYGQEVHSHVLWWGFAIDTHSLLTGSGNGEFAETLLSSNMLQQSTGLPSTGSTSFSCQKSFDCQTPSILDFHRIILTMAARLALLARSLRQEFPHSCDSQDHLSTIKNMQRKQEVAHLRDQLRQAWDIHVPTFIAHGFSNESVPIEARGIFEHVSP